MTISGKIAAYLFSIPVILSATIPERFFAACAFHSYIGIMFYIFLFVIPENKKGMLSSCCNSHINIIALYIYTFFTVYFSSFFE